MQREGRSLPCDRLNLNAAAKLFDVLANHVHADAAAGDIRDLIRSGKSRLKDKLKDSSLRKCGSFFNKSPLLRLLKNLRSIQAPPIIGNFDHNLAGQMLCGQ